MYDVMFYGWENDKFVLLVVDVNKKIKHRISMSKEEAGFVRDEIDRPTGQAQSYPYHQQIDTEGQP